MAQTAFFKAITIIYDLTVSTTKKILVLKMRITDVIPAKFNAKIVNLFNFVVLDNYVFKVEISQA